MQPQQPPPSAEPPPEQPLSPPYSSQPPYGQQAFPGSSPQPPAYGYYPPPTYGAPVYTPPTSTSAIVSLVCSIASWIFLPFIGAIVGIVFGHIARREIQRANGAIRGNGLAIAGLIIGYLYIALAVGVVLLIIVIAIGYSASSSSSSILIAQTLTSLRPLAG